MAIRVEELQVPLEAPGDARVYRFPVEAVRARPSRAERRRRAIARRRAYRRRRVGLGVLVVVMSLTLLFAGGPSSIAPASGPRAPKAIVVQPGQTLWSLAERYAGPGIDPRAYVDAVVALNGLEGMPEAGARIKLPR